MNVEYRRDSCRNDEIWVGNVQRNDNDILGTFGIVQQSGDKSKGISEKPPN